MTQTDTDTLPMFTIGHARHPLEEFIQLLQREDIEHLVDVRSFPRSRTNPQFNIDTLPGALRKHGISYEHMPELGGRRKVQGDISPQLNALWENRSFHNYADYSQKPAFAKALAHLAEVGTEKRTAFMCSETVWWRCHRRIVSDWLLAQGKDVWHILPQKTEQATFTRGAEVSNDGRVTYPATSGQLWPDDAAAG